LDQAIDPRTARSRASMLAAATELLEAGGMAAVTHKAVAEAAGVGRATVYRHWPRPLDLLLATLECAKAGSVDFTDGPIRDVIYANFLRRIAWFNQPIASTVIGSLISGAEHDPDIAKIRDGLFHNAIRNMTSAITGAVGRGELLPATPAHTVATMIIGAVIFERHMLSSTITPETLATIIDTALGPWLADKA
jgi:AcrR family transcriptional regulator